MTGAKKTAILPYYRNIAVFCEFYQVMKNYINYQYIDSLRRNKSMTHKELGQIIDLSYSHVSGLCNGKTMTTLPKLIEISKFFNVPLTNLILDTPHGN